MAQAQPPIQLPIDEPKVVDPNGKVTSRVRITAPRQNNSRRVYFTLEDLPRNRPPDPTSFNYGRIVMNIRLSKDGAIAPPVKLEFELTPKEAQHAANGALKVAYHDKTQWRELAWKLKDGFVVVDFDKVGDPPIGVSP